MLSLSREFAELAVQSSHASGRVAEAETRAEKHSGQAHEHARKEAREALEKVQRSLAERPQFQPSRFESLMEKITSDLRRLRLAVGMDSAEAKAMRASDYADHLRFEAESAIGYAIAAAKMAELATLEAIAARAAAETRETEASRAEEAFGGAKGMISRVHTPELRQNSKE